MAGTKTSATSQAYGRLVCGFRSVPTLAAPPAVNFGINGTLAKLRRQETSNPLHYRRRMTAASSHEIARYITDETIARIAIEVMTMFILKIWLPYWMR